MRRSSREFRMWALRRLWPIVAAVAVVGLSTAQEASESESGEAVFRTETALMEVEVRVRDGSGRRVPDLTIEDFKLSENGKQQEIATLEYVSDPTREAVIRAPVPGVAAGEVRA